MITDTNDKKFRAALYLRLSQEDGDKLESDSISNQRELGMSYLKDHPEIELAETWIDDGYSGAHYDNRPGFTKMMEAVQAGTINCIIVKDFSRLGRNFVVTGKLIEKILPFFGVRFIAINEYYDSIRPRTASDQLVVPIKNLSNEFVISCMSNNIRDVLANKRQRGEYVAPFAMYGYNKDPQNKHQLIVDEFSAGVVGEMFRMVLEGYFAEAIAKKLNAQGTLSPLEYKKLMGSSYNTPFKKNVKAKWSAQTVLRVLKNPVYTGVLEQGKRSTPNYKVRKQFPVPKDKWSIKENAHEPIVSKEIFYAVARILSSDMRTAPGQETVYLFSGLLFCGDCKRSMVRKNNGTSEAPYYYYICSGSKEHSGCSSHSIRDELLEEVVLKAVKNHIKTVLDIEKTLLDIRELPYTSRAVKKADERLATVQMEIEKYRRYKVKLYEHYADGIVSEADYRSLVKRYDDKIIEATESLHGFEKKIDDLLAGNSEQQQWINHFAQYKNIKALDRKLIIELIDRIWIFDNKRVEINFRFQCQYEDILDCIQSVTQLQSQNIDTSLIKEVV